jgi:hypothetical protein
MDQQIEHLRLDRNEVTPRAQFTAVGVQSKISKEI